MGLIKIITFHQEGLIALMCLLINGYYDPLCLLVDNDYGSIFTQLDTDTLFHQLLHLRKEAILAIPYDILPFMAIDVDALLQLPNLHCRHGQKRIWS